MIAQIEDARETRAGVALLVPLAVVTVTFRVPSGVLASIVKVAVIRVELVTRALVTVIPSPALTASPSEVKSVPVRMTLVVAPWKPLFGLTAVNLGAASITVNATGALSPLRVVIVTFRAPSDADALMANRAVNVVEFTTTPLVTVIPGPASTYGAAKKLLPVRVTSNVVPRFPVAGLMLESVEIGRAHV